MSDRVWALHGLLYLPSERSETVGDYVFTFVCVCVCAHSAWDNILLETSFYWLSEDVVRFNMEVGVEEKCKKM